MSDGFIPFDLGRGTDTASRTFSDDTSLFMLARAIDALLNTVNTNTGTINTNTAQGGTSVIKSVQRGTSSGGTTIANIAITISTVVPSKCMVTFDGFRNTAISLPIPPTIASLTATVLTIGAGYTASSTFSSLPFSWQIIEFY